MVLLWRVLCLCAAMKDSGVAAAKNKGAEEALTADYHMKTSIITEDKIKTLSEQVAGQESAVLVQATSGVNLLQSKQIEGKTSDFSLEEELDEPESAKEPAGGGDEAKAMMRAMTDHGDEESNQTQIPTENPDEEEPERLSLDQQQVNSTLDNEEVDMGEEKIPFSNLQMDEVLQNEAEGERVGSNSSIVLESAAMAEGEEEEGEGEGRSSRRRRRCRFKADGGSISRFSQKWHPLSFERHPCVAAWSKQPNCGEGVSTLWGTQSGTTGRYDFVAGHQCGQGSVMHSYSRGKVFQSYVIRIHRDAATSSNLGADDGEIVCTLSLGRKSLNHWWSTSCSLNYHQFASSFPGTTYGTCDGAIDSSYRNAGFTDWKLEISHRRRFQPWINMYPGTADPIVKGKVLQNTAIDTPTSPLPYRFMMNVMVTHSISSGLRNIVSITNDAGHDAVQARAGYCGCRSGDIPFNGGVTCRGCSSTTFFCDGYLYWKHDWCDRFTTEGNCNAHQAYHQGYICKWFPQEKGQCGCRSGDIAYRGGVTCRASNGYIYWKSECLGRAPATATPSQIAHCNAGPRAGQCLWNPSAEGNQVRLPAIYQVPGSNNNYWKLMVVSSRQSHRSDGCYGLVNMVLNEWHRIIVEVENGRLVVTSKPRTSETVTTQCTNDNYHDPEHGGIATKMYMSDKTNDYARGYLNGFLYRVPGHNRLYEKCGCKDMVEDGVGEAMTHGPMADCSNQFAASKLPALGDAVGQAYNAYNVFSTCANHCSNPALDVDAMRKKCAAEVVVTALSAIPFVGDLAAAGKCLAEKIDPYLYQRECIGSSMALAASNSWVSNVTLGQTLKFLQKDEKFDIAQASFGKPWGMEWEGTVFMMAETAQISRGLTFHTECGAVQVTKHHELLVWDQDNDQFMRAEAEVVRSKNFSHLVGLGPNGNLGKCSIENVSDDQFTSYMPLVANLTDVAVGDYLIAEGGILLPTYSRTLQRISDTEAHDAFLSWVKVMPLIRDRIPCLITSSVASGTNTLVDMFEKFIADHEHAPDGYAVVLKKPYALICYAISHVQEHYQDDVQSCPQLETFHDEHCKDFAKLPLASDANESDASNTLVKAP